MSSGVTVYSSGRGESFGGAATKVPVAVGRRAGSGAASGSDRIKAILAELDPSLLTERLSTEGLTDVMHAEIFNEANHKREAYAPVTVAAEIAGAGITKTILAAARAAVRKRQSGVGAALTNGLRIQVNPERHHTVYVDLRRGKAAIVIRLDRTPGGGLISFIHEMTADVREALRMLAELASCWESLEGGNIETAPAAADPVRTAGSMLDPAMLFATAFEAFK